MAHGTFHQSGSTLMELVVGTTIAIFMLSSLVFISSDTTSFSVSSLNRDRLNYQMQRTLYLMTYDLRRAGYWGNASSGIGSGANNNPMMASGTDITITGGSCILFTLDRDKNGALNTSGGATAHEHYGYRFNANAVQGLTTDTNYSCTSTNSAWENVSDTNVITVTALSFTPTNVTMTVIGTSHTVTIRYITISMTANLVSDTSVTQTLSENIRVRADKYVN